MRGGRRIGVVIPALNEEAAIGRVIADIPDWADDIVVVDNGSSDRTAEVAAAAGARVLFEPRRGYGSACLRGIASFDGIDIIVFLDGDYSDRPEEMARVVDPIVLGRADMVVGSRELGSHLPGALTPQARFGNRLSCALLRLFWGARYTDLGPFRAISACAYERMGMRDPDYGWTIESQIKAALYGLRAMEVPVSYRPRIGKSKVSGTVRGVIGAGTTILYTIFRAALDVRYLKSAEPPPSERLILFTRYPEPGSAKTRLAPAIGDTAAADLQRRLTERAAAAARETMFRRRAELEVRFDGGSSALMRQWLGPGQSYRPQGEGDIGERMAGALAAAFREGMERAVLFGSDVPGIDAGAIRRALDGLDSADLVLGPAADGGYYLLGLSSDASEAALPALFGGMSWSGPDVLDETLARAAEAGLSVGLLDELRDVDCPEDLGWLAGEYGIESDPKMAAKVSVIVPAIDEEHVIGDTVRAACAHGCAEAIVVDGGSFDGTASEAEAAGARVIGSARGRAAQQNAGAEEAHGEILMFLHADTLLPGGWEDDVRAALAEPGTVMGAFELGIGGPGAGLRLVERLANWRSRRWGLPYGDQAMFVGAETFRIVGGFPDQPIMEDYELARRLARLGRVRIVNRKVMTSPRRWEKLGALRTTLVNQAIIVGYRLGVPPARLDTWYRGKRRSTIG